MLKTPEGDSPPAASPAEIPERLSLVRDTILRWWPEYWPAHEACLSTAATLLLENIAQCVSLVLIGDSGGGKGTILYGYSKSARTVFRSRFTAASLLSTHGDSKKEELEARALFRQVKHKLFVCEDLNPLFKVNEGEGLGRFYADFAIWLNGEGLVYDSGTHGLVGQQGDYTFSMVAGATPFRRRIWRAMAELGPRLLFLRLGHDSTHVPASMYDRARDDCATAIRDFLEWLFTSFPVRSLPWRHCQQETEDQIFHLCKLAAAGQTFGGGNIEDGDGPIRPTPAHLFQRLSTVTHAHAILCGRSCIGPEDLAFAENIAQSSTVGARGKVLFLLNGGTFDIPDLVRKSGLSTASVEYILNDLSRSGVVAACATFPQMTAGGDLTRGRPMNVWKLCP